jgi:hypothetical protein
MATEVTARQSRNKKPLATEGTEFTEILAKDNAGHGYPMIKTDKIHYKNLYKI